MDRIRVKGSKALVIEGTEADPLKFTYETPAKAGTSDAGERDNDGRDDTPGTPRKRRRRAGPRS